MELIDVVKLECCEHNFSAKNKDDALIQLGKLIQSYDKLKAINLDIIVNALKEREAKGSTGFGHGIAIPHCSIDEIDEFIVAIAISKKGIDFDSSDKKKVRVFVTIVGPSSDRNGHLKLLAQVSRILRDPIGKEGLLKATTKVGLYEQCIRQTSSGIKELTKKGDEKLLLMIVKDDEIMQDISELFLEYGIEMATIIETQQMENLLSKVPLFMGFFNFTGERNPYSKIILTKITKNYINAIVKGLEDLFGDLDNYSGISLMVIDLFYSKGF